MGVSDCSKKERSRRYSTSVRAGRAKESSEAARLERTGRLARLLGSRGIWPPQAGLAPRRINYLDISPR